MAEEPRITGAFGRYWTGRSEARFGFLFNSLYKRFPARKKAEVHSVVETILEQMSPSRDRTCLESNSVRLLKQWEEEGERPEIVIQGRRQADPPPN